MAKDGCGLPTMSMTTVELARLCDSLGYHRYWVAEHHASVGLAGCAPEAMIGPLGLRRRPRDLETQQAAAGERQARVEQELAELRALVDGLRRERR